MAKKKINAKPQPQEPQDASMMTPERFLKLAARFLPAINANATTPEARREQLGAYYELGRLLLEHLPKGSRYGDNQLTKLSEALGHGNSWLSTVRRFAVKYDQEEFDELLGLDLAWGHVRLLVGLKGSERTAYQKLAAQKKWTVEDLRLELQKRAAVAGRHGKRVKVPDNLESALRQLLGEGEIWKSRCELIAEKLEGPKKFSAKLQGQVQEAAPKLRAIAKTAQEVAQQLEAKP